MVMGSDWDFCAKLGGGFCPWDVEWDKFSGVGESSESEREDIARYMFECGEEILAGND